MFAQCPRRGSCRRRLRDADPIRQVQIVGRAAAAAGVGPASAFTPRTVKFIFFSGVVASAETLTRESVGDERKKQNKKKKENENVNKYHRNLVRARRNAARTFSYRNKKKKKSRSYYLALAKYSSELLTGIRTRLCIDKKKKFKNMNTPRFYKTSYKTTKKTVK